MARRESCAPRSEELQGPAAVLDFVQHPASGASHIRQCLGEPVPLHQHLVHAIAGAQAAPRRLFQLTGMDRVFRLCDTVAEAEAALAAGATAAH